MKTNNRAKFARITEKVFRGVTKMAKFTLNVNDVKADRQGIFVPIDGTLDFDTISNSFLNAGSDLEGLADELTKKLLEDKNKEQINKLIKPHTINVDNIDKNKYKIIHDENKNELYLFLPIDAIDTASKENSEKAINEEKGSRTKEVIEGISNALKKFIEGHRCEIKSNSPNDVKILLNNKSVSENPVEKYGVIFKIEKIPGKRDDRIESRIVLQLTYDEKIVYDKQVKQEFKYEDDKLKLSNRDKNSIIFDVKDNNPDKEAPDKAFEDMEKNAKSLLEKINKFDDEAIKAFQEDIQKGEVKEKVEEEKSKEEASTPKEEGTIEH